MSLIKYLTVSIQGIIIRMRCDYMKIKPLCLICMIMYASSGFSRQTPVPYYTVNSMTSVHFEASPESRQSFVLYENDVVKIESERTVTVLNTAQKWSKVSTNADKGGWCLSESLVRMKTFSSNHGFTISYYPEWNLEDIRNFENSYNDKGNGEFTFVIPSNSSSEDAFWYFFKDRLDIAVTVRKSDSSQFERVISGDIRAETEMALSESETLVFGGKTMKRIVLHGSGENQEEKMFLYYQCDDKLFRAGVVPYDSRMLGGLLSVFSTIQSG